MSPASVTSNHSSARANFVVVASSSAVKAKAETKSGGASTAPVVHSRSVRAVLANSRVSRSMRLNDHGGV